MSLLEIRIVLHLRINCIRFDSESEITTDVIRLFWLKEFQLN